MHRRFHGILTQYSTWKFFTYKIKWRALPEIPSLLFILCPKGSRLFGKKLQTNPRAAAKDINEEKNQLNEKSRISHERWFCVLNMLLVIVQLCVPYKNNQIVTLGATDVSIWKQFNCKCWPRWMVCNGVWGLAKRASKQRLRWRKSLRQRSWCPKTFNPPHNHVKRGPK